MVGRHESKPASCANIDKAVLTGSAASQYWNDFDSCQHMQVLRQSGF